MKMVNGLFLGAAAIILYVIATESSLLTTKSGAHAVAIAAMIITYFSGLLIGGHIAEKQIGKRVSALEQRMFTTLNEVEKFLMKDICVVCKKTIRKGDRAGFAPLHAGECTDKWNNWSEEQRRQALENLKEVS